jgi:F420-non-reducing hydrogenase iron-sulfur subunit
LAWACVELANCESAGPMRRVLPGALRGDGLLTCHRTRTTQEYCENAMTRSAGADAIVYVCANCAPDGALPSRQWEQDGAGVLVCQVPCSGKSDLQYLLHALEGGARGICVVACPRGQCQLAQGNYRAEIRIGTLRRLLAEIGIEPERAELVHASPHDPPDRFAQLVRDAVGRICALGESPLRTETRDSTLV